MHSYVEQEKVLYPRGLIGAFAILLKRLETFCTFSHEMAHMDRIKQEGAFEHMQNAQIIQRMCKVSSLPLSIHIL